MYPSLSLPPTLPAPLPPRCVLLQAGRAEGSDEDGAEHGAARSRELPAGGAGARGRAPTHQPAQGQLHSVRHLQRDGPHRWPRGETSDATQAARRTPRRLHVLGFVDVCFV